MPKSPTPNPSQEGIKSAIRNPKSKIDTDSINLTSIKEEEMNTPLATLDRGELMDIDKVNFLAWYRDATVEEIAVARRNNSAKLDELTRKYEAEINLMEIFLPPRRHNP